MNPHYDTIAEACRTWLAAAGDDDRDYLIAERRQRILDLARYFEFEDTSFRHDEFLWKVGL